MTCIHLVTGLRETPATHSHLFATTIIVAGSNIAIPLQANGKYRFIAANDPSDGMFFDVMIVPLSPAEEEALSKFGEYDGDSIIQAKIGQNVTMEGFPGLGLEVVNHTVQYSSIIQVHGVSVVLSKPSQPGFSGGPVLCGSNLIGVAFGDIGTPPNYTNGMVNSFHVLKSVLFR